MTHAPLWLFVALVFGIIVLPGLDMAFVLGSTLTGGRRRGCVAVAGIVAGGICHVAMTGLGISVLLKTIPGAFNALLLAGALYIAWIGWSLIRVDPSADSSADSKSSPKPLRSASATFGQGVLTSLLNPKAYLFMLAIFPQFLRPQEGTLWLQAMRLWSIIAINQLCVYGGLTLLADKTRHWLHDKPAASTTMARSVGALLIVAAMFTSFAGWRAL
ncbi:LysE family translocator [Rhodanobacter sp. L36]|uniref:LysE family translocator n=1 Tax=Rhodanobacter sp. L36 TaxID=1747221 RepID=UPI00131BFFD8|nr:LysE family translocator [Rhodanobacter sp. L36]